MTIPESHIFALSWAASAKLIIRKAVFPALFCSILFYFLWCINNILQPKYCEQNNIWPTTSTFKQFYKMKKNSVDVLFLGSSHCVSAFCPQAVYNCCGIRSYNLGSEMQSVFASYYWLKEALKYQSPKAVVLDTHFFLTWFPGKPLNTKNEMLGKCIDPMRFSAVKREFVSDFCFYAKTADPLSFYLPNIRFHSRWKELQDIDFEFSGTAHLKGFGALYGRPSEKFVPSGSKNLGISARPSPFTLMYLDKIAALCREKGIQLVFMGVPSPFISNIEDTVISYAKAHNIRYYNLGRPEYYNQLNIQFPKESFAMHCNIWGADKAADLIGRILKEDCGVPSAEDEQWESTRGYYAKILAKGNLSFTEDADEYLKAVKDDDYCVFISVKDEAFSGIKDTAWENLRSLGLKADCREKLRGGYWAVIRPGFIEEDTGKDTAVHTGHIRGGEVSYSIGSGGNCQDSGSLKSSIIIDGREYSPDLPGLNIVVYDNELRRVIDAVNFNTCGRTEQKARRPAEVFDRL